MSKEPSVRSDDRLVAAAVEASKASYAPYSNFHVGAALETADGAIVTGTNVENRSYGLAICAERAAVVTAVTQGHREFTSIAIYSPDSDYPVPPCGACRQVLSEFMAPDATMIFVAKDGSRAQYSVAEVFPYDALHELRER